jgi:CheY-like chemotaxis protein
MVRTSVVIDIRSKESGNGFSLGKGPAAKLVCTREALDSMIASIPVHDAVKRLPRRMVQDLGEGQFANVHEHLQPGECRKGAHIAMVIQIRDNLKSHGTLVPIGV